MRHSASTYLRYLVVAHICLLSACDESINDLEHYVSNIKIHASGTIEPIPEYSHPAAFIYPQRNKDPFDNRDWQTHTKSTQPVIKGIQLNTQRKRQPLEYFALKSLQMVGTLERKKQRWALVKAVDKQIYRVKVGDYLSSNHGKIIMITPQTIHLNELIPNATGAYSRRDNRLHLAKKLSTTAAVQNVIKEQTIE
jgi:type IV pilus assembly protein PilP